MAVANQAAYAKLLAETRPRVIDSDRENMRAIAELERLDALPRKTAAQRAVADLLAVLIERFEQRYDLGDPTPLEALRSLMEARGERQRDLVPVFGASGIASEVLNGKRAISKRHARLLAEHYGVSVSLFI